MKVSSDIKPGSYLKSHVADILTQNGKPRAVLQDPESYDPMRNAIGLLKLISQGEEDIKHGRTKTQEEVFKNMEMLLTAKEKK